MFSCASNSPPSSDEFVTVMHCISTSVLVNLAGACNSGENCRFSLSLQGPREMLILFVRTELRVAQL